MYSTHEMAELLGISKRTLHYYEEEGLIAPTRSIDNNYRQYSNSDVEQVKRIISLKEIGFGIDDIKKFFTFLDHQKKDLEQHFIKRYSKCLMELEKIMKQKHLLYSLINKMPENTSEIFDLVMNEEKIDYPFSIAQERCSFLDACRKGDLAFIRELLENNKAGIEEADAKGRTPLILSTMFGHEEVVKFLLSKGCELNRRDDLGVSAVMRASLDESISILKLLIKSGADIDLGDLWGTTPLVGAVFHKKNKSVKELLEAGADRNISTTHGHTAITVSESVGNVEAKELLTK